MNMEVLDALERRVTELLNELAALRELNAQLEVKAPGGDTVQGQSEIARLEAALREERRLRQAVLQRVDALIERLEEQNSAG